MKFVLTLILFISALIVSAQYNYGLEVERQDTKIEGKLNIDSGSENVFIGNYVGLNNVPNVQTLDGIQNLFLGFSAGEDNIHGANNVFIGHSAGESNIDGDLNTIIGYLAGAWGSLGSRNTLIGTRSGLTNSGFSNTFIGADSGFNADGNQNIFIGNQAGRNNDNSERLIIENSSSSTPLIYGEFDNDRTGINWDSTIALPATLSINGTLHISEIVKLEPQTTQPSCGTGDMGSLYSDTNGVLYFCNGLIWKTVQLN